MARVEHSPTAVGSTQCCISGRAGAGHARSTLPAFKKLHEEFATRGLTALSSRSTTTPRSWQKTLKGLELPWPQGRLGTASPSGVSGVPAYWLLDPAGKIVAKADHSRRTGSDSGEVVETKTGRPLVTGSISTAITIEFVLTRGAREHSGLPPRPECVSDEPRFQEVVQESRKPPIFELNETSREMALPGWFWLTPR